MVLRRGTRRVVPVARVIAVRWSEASVWGFGVGLGIGMFLLLV
jgi:hypothetical protein